MGGGQSAGPEVPAAKAARECMLQWDIATVQAVFVRAATDAAERAAAAASTSAASSAPADASAVAAAPVDASAVAAAPADASAVATEPAETAEPASEGSPPPPGSDGSDGGSEDGAPWLVSRKEFFDIFGVADFGLIHVRCASCALATARRRAARERGGGGEHTHGWHLRRRAGWQVLVVAALDIWHVRRGEDGQGGYQTGLRRYIPQPPPIPRTQL